MIRFIYKYVCAALIATAALTACSDEVSLDDNWQPSLSPHRLSLSSYSVQIQPDGGQESVKVLAENAAWRLEGNDAEWLQLAPRSGSGAGAITLTASPNLDPTTGRTAAYLFRSADEGWNFSRQFAVSQSAPGYYIRLTEKNFTKTASSQQFDVSVEANADWQAKSDQDWLSCITAAKSLTISLKENTTSLSSDRIAHVTLTCGNATEIITVNQQPPHIEAQTDPLTFEQEGGTYSIGIESEVAWTASCSQPWLTVSPTESNAGKVTLVINAAANMTIDERKGNVYINIGGNELYNIPVTQRGAYIDTDVAILPVFGYEGGSQAITVKANTEWRVISKPEFVNITPDTGGKGETTVIISTSPNTTETPYNGDIVLGYDKITGIQTKIHVEQECPYIDYAGETTITLPSTAGEHQLTISSNQSWVAQLQKGSWAHIDKTSGNGDTMLTITAENNPSVSKREDQLTITPTVSNKPITFIIRQKGKELSVSESTINISPYGGTSNPVVVTTDGTWEITTSDTWFTVQRDGQTFTLYADFNDTEKERTGNVIVALTDLPQGEEKKITVAVIQKTKSNLDGCGFGDDQNWNF